MDLRKASLVFLGTTALCTSEILYNGIASAQTTNSQAQPANSQPTDTNTQIDLGSVTAQGSQGSSDDSNGYLAPTGTGTQAQAIAKQRSAPNVIFVQPAETMRKQAAANVAENLRNMPGVSMQSDSGFGRFYVINGLPEDLNATQYGGVLLPPTNTNASPTRGSRAVALDSLAPGIIGGAEKINSLTPDMPATGLGGVINLLPPTLPNDGKPLLDITAGGGFSNLQGNPLGQVNITAGDRFAIPGLEGMENPKPFSFIGSFGYINLSPGIFDLEESYTNPTVAGNPAMLNQLQNRRSENNRITYGGTAELDFDPNPNVHLFVRGLYSDLTETISANNLNLNNLDGTAGGSVVNNGNNSFTATGANVGKHYEQSTESTGLAFVEAGGKFVVGDLATLDFHSAYTAGWDKYGPDYAINFSSNDQNLTIPYSTANPASRSYMIQTAAGQPFNVTNPNNYTFSDLTKISSQSITQIYDNGLSASVPTSFLDTIGTFKVGGNVTLTHRGFSQDTTTGTPNNGPFSLASVTGGQSNQTNYSGMYDVGPSLNYGQFWSQPYTWTTNNTANLLAWQADQENVYAGFWQETLQYGRLGVLAGMRVEATDASYSGYGSSTDNAGNTIVNKNTTTRTQSYVNVFPSVQLSYAFAKNLQGRFAYSTGIARPGFQQINPASAFTILGGQGGRDLMVTGNPNLKPQTANSYDLALAYYPGGGQDNVLEVDLFQKDISNYIVPLTTNTSTTTFQTFGNINGARASGITLEAIEHFRFLPAPLNGLGIDANATFVNASGNVIQGQGRSVLPETYPVTFNVTEMYEEGPYQFGLTESYVGKNLYTVGSDPSTNVYTQPMYRMDANVAYQVTPQWQLFFQARNLTDARLTFTQSSSAQFPIQSEYYGQTFLLGAHFHL